MSDTRSTAPANYVAWRVSAADYPAAGNRAEKLSYFARFGVLAPSVHNSQPWQITLTGNGIRVSPDMAHALPHADPDGSYLRMSLGMCGENIAIAARWFCHTVEQHVEADGTIALAISPDRISIQTSECLSPDLIVARASDKRPYLDQMIPAEILTRIAAAVSHDVASCRFETGPDARCAIVAAHKRAIAETARDTRFARELAGLLRANTTRGSRGMPGFVAGVATLPSLIVPPILRVFPQLLRLLVANEAEQVVSHSAGFGLILADAHGVATDVAVGRAYQRAALLLRRVGIADAMITAAVFQPHVRADLQRALRTTSEIRLLFRIGYPPPGERRPTPRQPAP